MGLYEHIRDAAKERGYSINRLEKELGFARSSINKFNKNTPSAEKIQQIADLLGVSVDRLMNGTQENESYSPCPNCGLYYDSSNATDIKYHAHHHDAWKKASEKFGTLYCNYSENELIKAHNRNISHDLSRSLDDRYSAQLEVLRCLFSRSISACDFDLSHVDFETYVSMVLGNGSYRKNNLEDDLYQKLVNKFGTSTGIPYGSTYYTVPTSQVLAAHFTGEEYTDAELEEIYGFAEFVRSKRKN